MGRHSAEHSATLDAPMSTADVFDVVVIGGGHNGLVAACYLARAGQSVLLVERQPQLGGMALSAPLIDTAPDHMVNPGAYENVYLRAGGVVEDLGLRRFGYREVDSVGWAWLGDNGESLLFQAGVEETADDIARFSRRDAAAYRELVAIALKAVELQGRYGSGPPGRPSLGTVAAGLRSLVGNRVLRSTLAGLLTGTAAEAIVSTFESAQMRGAFASIATILGAPTAEGSALALLGTSSLHGAGAARPIGGMGGLVLALEKCLTSYGGVARTGLAASEIHHDAKRATGVTLSDGTSISARHAVVTAIPPQRVPDLIGDGISSGLAERLRAAPANAGGVATLTVNLALSDRLELPAHQPSRTDVDLRKPALFTGSFDGVMMSCAQASRGEIPTEMPWWCTIFTAMDPSQAPPGQDTAQLYGPVPVAAAGGWDQRRDEAATLLLNQVAAALPGVHELEIGRFVETPEDLTRRTTTVNGCLYHVDHLATRMGPLRPALGVAGYRTPLRGLYLTGAGFHPSGGISGLPGKHAATAVLRDL
jgi:phytoene dehydrogenase-like protein